MFCVVAELARKRMVVTTHALLLLRCSEVNPCHRKYPCLLINSFSHCPTGAEKIAGLLLLWTLCIKLCYLTCQVVFL